MMASSWSGDRQCVGLVLRSREDKTPTAERNSVEIEGKYREHTWEHAGKNPAYGQHSALSYASDSIVPILYHESKSIQ